MDHSSGRVGARTEPIAHRLRPTGVGKKLLYALSLCLLVAGCTRSTDGAATAMSDESTSLPSILARQTAAPAVEFDPCALSEALLGAIGLAGVNPAPVAGVGGCLWANNIFGVGVSLVEDTSYIEDPAARPEVTALETIPYADYTTYLFVLDGDTYLTQTMTERGALLLSATDLRSDGLDTDRRISADTFHAFAPYLPPPR
jgi:Protein of unknown function (DUF3558)